MKYWLLLANTIVGLFILAAIAAVIVGATVAARETEHYFGDLTAAILPLLIVAAYFVGRWAQNQ